MTALERALYRRRTMLFVIAALLFLGGAVTVAFIQIRHESARADQLADEADLRGGAVSTLAGDVRALRAQVQSAGKTPVAPDPSKAIPSLPDRTAVPVPIPGPPGDPGAPGMPGAQGEPGPSGSPGPSGAAGVDGASGVDGQPGAPGRDGVDGQNGVDGKDGAPGAQGEPGAAGPAGPAGPSCPTGYTLQPALDDPDALVCRRDGAPASPPATTSQPALLDRRRV